MGINLAAEMGVVTQEKSLFKMVLNDFRGMRREGFWRCTPEQRKRLVKTGIALAAILLPTVGTGIWFGMGRSNDDYEGPDLLAAPEGNEQVVKEPGAGQQQDTTVTDSGVAGVLEEADAGEVERMSVVEEEVASEIQELKKELEQELKQLPQGITGDEIIKCIIRELNHKDLVEEKRKRIAKELLKKEQEQLQRYASSHVNKEYLDQLGRLLVENSNTVSNDQGEKGGQQTSTEDPTTALLAEWERKNAEEKAARNQEVGSVSTTS